MDSAQVSAQQIVMKIRPQQSKEALGARLPAAV
jgi:hypothetical protein